MAEMDERAVMVEDDRERLMLIRQARRLRTSRAVLFYAFFVFIMVRIWIFVLESKNGVLIGITGLASLLMFGFWYRGQRRNRRRQHDMDQLEDEDGFIEMLHWRAALVDHQQWGPGGTDAGRSGDRGLSTEERDALRCVIFRSDMLVDDSSSSYDIETGLGARKGSVAAETASMQLLSSTSASSSSSSTTSTAGDEGVVGVASAAADFTGSVKRSVSPHALSGSVNGIANKQQKNGYTPTAAADNLEGVGGGRDRGCGGGRLLRVCTTLPVPGGRPEPRTLVPEGARSTTEGSAAPTMPPAPPNTGTSADDNRGALSTTEPTEPEAEAEVKPQSVILYSEATCTICLEEYHDGDELTILQPCTHLYHKHCISEWLRSQALCPLCKRRVEVPPLTEEQQRSMRERQLQEQQTEQRQPTTLVIHGLAL